MKRDSSLWATRQPTAGCRPTASKIDSTRVTRRPLGPKTQPIAIARDCFEVPQTPLGVMIARVHVLAGETSNASVTLLQQWSLGCCRSSRAASHSNYFPKIYGSGTPSQLSKKYEKNYACWRSRQSHHPISKRFFRVAPHS